MASAAESAAERPREGPAPSCRGFRGPCFGCCRWVLPMGVADGRVEADGEVIYQVKDMKVGLAIAE